ncbi:MAG: hypothetical protein QHH10_10605 [Peptococcaceae bacterium]|jgi:hypothetical protein|nr:hypothetical protein [Eubacteriales bacterium]MDH7525748.1 hypothetical protein [Peptococcaceae bacterium]
MAMGDKRVVEHEVLVEYYNDGRNVCEKQYCLKEKIILTRNDDIVVAERKDWQDNNLELGEITLYVLQGETEEPYILSTENNIFDLTGLTGTVVLETREDKVQNDKLIIEL